MTFKELYKCNVLIQQLLSAFTAVFIFLTAAFDCLRKDLLDFKLGAACEGADRLAAEALGCGHDLLGVSEYKEKIKEVLQL